jgi:hypothetical protein
MMIYVVTEDVGVAGALGRNAHIQAQADIARRTALYGEIVTDRAELRARLTANDRTLYLFAHGNHWVVGRFDDMGDLVAHLRDDLGAFENVHGRTLNEIYVNSCDSENHAAMIAAILRNTVIPGRFFTVVGTRGRSFTDAQGNVRVARGDDEADELDANTHLNADRFQQMIDRNCLAVGEGLATWQCP